MKRFLPLALFTLCAAAANAGVLFMGAYPNSIIVIDDTNGKVVQRIMLETGLPTSLRMSFDKKSIIVATNDHAGIEVIDIASRKVVNKWVLNDATHRFRFGGGTVDPKGEFLYGQTTEITKMNDRFEVGKPKYSIIDMKTGKIAKTFDVPANQANGGGGNRGGGFEISPDGKYLYQFGSQITVFKAEDFSEVEKIDLAQPDGPALENLGFGGLQESLSEPGQRVSIFNYSDPIVHNKVFGLAHFDLNTRKFDFTPIGPAPVAMSNLRITPDKKMGYMVTNNGTGGNKRCEFWAIDLTTSRMAGTSEVICRSRYSFGLSGDGQKLYIYGAGFEIDVYDAKTFKSEGTWDLQNDTTGGGMIYSAQ
ncbi:MAG: hypothetical protein ABIR70_03210 [Bryobacteraceae bacterium]